MSELPDEISYAQLEITIATDLQNFDPTPFYGKTTKIPSHVYNSSLPMIEMLRAKFNLKKIDVIKRPGYPDNQLYVVSLDPKL